ncbi:MAG: hypothetical protein ABI182_05290 [Candidatus Baltobacteraceae bacterium]
MATSPQRGLPPRAYLPVVLIFAVIFLGIMGYLVGKGFGVTGAVFGSSDRPGATQPAQNVNVEGGPPAAVRLALGELRAQIQRDPKDDVALTQLGDLYLSVGKYTQAIPFYTRALAANPKNVAAKAGLDEAKSGLEAQNQ